MEPPPKLEFADALKDSPRFRRSVAENEQHVMVLENKLKEVLRLSQTTIEFGKTYVAAFYNLVTAVDELNKTCFSYDPVLSNTYSTVTEAYMEVVKFQKVLVEQAHWTIVKNVNDFMKREIGRIHEMKSQFSRVSQTLDDALLRNSQVSKTKPLDAVEARNELTAVGTCFAHTALDYVFHLNMIQTHKNHHLLDAFLALLRACSTYFHQGHDFFGEWKMTDNALGETIADLKTKSVRIERKMQDRHTLVPKEVYQHPPGMPTDADVVMEGYLFKRATNAFKQWHRRWFMVRENKLLYCHRGQEHTPSADKQARPQKITGDGYTVMEPDLRLCLVRAAPPQTDRIGCFELVTPTKNHMLQADSDSLCQAWMKALQRSIESALHDDERSDDDYGAGAHGRHSRSDGNTNTDSKLTDNSSHQLSSSSSEGVSTCDVPPVKESLSNNGANSPVSPMRGRKAFVELRKVAGNNECADCGAPNPKWASITFGVTVCIECCGMHRSLGVQVSKTRSLTMDAWEPETVNLMRLLGNTVVNGIYLRYLPATINLMPPPARQNSTRPIRLAWIKAKYVDRRFVRPPPKPPSSYRLRDAQLTREVTPPIRQLDATTDGAGCSVDSRRLRLALSSPAADNRVRSTPSLERIDELPTPVESSSRIANVELAANRLSCGSEGTLNILGTDQEPHVDLDAAVDVEALNKELMSASADGDVPMMLTLLAVGAQPNCRIGTENELSSTPLHQAMLSGCLEASEFLLVNGARINAIDSRGRTPLHVASGHSHTGQVCQLLKRGADQDVHDTEGRTALDIAVDDKHADIVTLLRLTKLRQEMGEADAFASNPMEETVMGVFDDISQMASANSAQQTLHRRARSCDVTSSNALTATVDTSTSLISAAVDC